MKKLHTAIIVVALAAATSGRAQVTISTEGTIAPNFFGSPSFTAWAANAQYAAENNLGTYGAAGPSQFNAVTAPLPVADNFSTGYNSWLGQAPGPYAGELGNRATFVGVINGNGALINIANLGLTMSQNGDSGTLDYTEPTFTSYTANNIGLIFSNGKDTSDGFTVVTSGDQNVNEIITVSHGNSYASYDTVGTGDDDPDPTATDQQILNYDISQVGSYGFTGTFTYGDVSGSDTMEFVAPVPETSTVLAGALMLLPFGASTVRFLRKNRTA